MSKSKFTKLGAQDQVWIALPPERDLAGKTYYKIVGRNTVTREVQLKAPGVETFVIYEAHCRKRGSDLTVKNVAETKKRRESAQRIGLGVR